MRFLADGEFFTARRTHDVAHVVVPMRRFIAARRNLMPIQIENFRLDNQVAQSGFLFGFTQSNPCQIDIAVRMPADRKADAKAGQTCGGEENKHRLNGA